MQRKRKLRKEAKLILAGLICVLVVILIVFISNFNIHLFNKHSLHDGASSYKTKDVLVFYPKTKNGRSIAKQVASKAEKNEIIDYALVPYGDYYLVEYPDKTAYLIDKDNNELEIKGYNDELKKIISDYLRYTLKSIENDEAYTYDFLVKTSPDKLNYNKITSEIVGTNLSVHCKEYNCSFNIPLSVLQDTLNIDLGYEKTLYTKPRYISKNRKMICFTFDDGPDISLETSGKIVEQLDKFDSSASFYIIGYRLGEKQINFCKEAVKRGIEYGSHSQSHEYLTKLSNTEIYNEIMTPYHDLYDNEYGFGYKMKTYRPPYGSINDEVMNSLDLTAILWNVDSLDWKYRTSLDKEDCIEAVVKKVKEETNENDIILFHDIYDTSVEAASQLLEYYIKEGYQIVSASELLEALNKTGVSSFRGQ